MDNPFGRLVGKRVEVWWAKKQRWFPGRIVEFDAFNGLHVVDYDDHTSAIHNLSKAKYRMEDSVKRENSPLRAKQGVQSASGSTTGAPPSTKRAKASEDNVAGSELVESDGSDDHIVLGNAGGPVHGASIAAPTGGTVAGLGTGPVVAAESGLAGPGRRVLAWDGTDYDANLTMVNMATNTDKYYRLQV